MKKLIVIVLLAALALLLVPIAGAAPSTYNSGFQVQNLSTTATANIVITFYNQNGSVAATVSDTVAANDSNTYFPLPTSVPSGFDGSVVISSDQAVAAITNILGDGFAFGASYGGFSQGAGNLNLPLVMKANFGFDTWFNVQNAGSGPTTVTVSYPGTSCTEQATISAGAAARFNQSTNTCLPNGFVGSAQVSAANASDSIVATVVETGATTLFAYNGFTSGSTNPVMPLMQANNFGYHSGIQIQNQGGSATNVTVSYSPSPGQPGTACTETQSIPAGQSKTFALYVFSLSGPGGTSNCTFGQRFIGSASVTANSTSQPLAPIVNQTNFAEKGSAYSGFDPNAASAKIVMPLIMDQNFGFYTGFNVLNVGSTATVTCSFSGVGSSFNVSQSLGSGQAMNHLQLNHLPAGYVGSATCTGGSIIGVVNELGSGAGDNLFTYEAFNE